MTPKRIIIIRHCDKPEPIPGNFCDAQGYLRARLLAGFDGTWQVSQSCWNPIKGTCGSSFWSDHIIDSLNSIFAAVSYYNRPMCHMNKSFYGSFSSSNRMCLIMEPTAYCYGKTINNGIVNYCVDEYSRLIDYIKDNCKDTVIIAWEHHHIPLMINYLLQKSGSLVRIPMWPSSASKRFDLVFTIDNPYTESANVTVTTQNFGLHGDSTEVPREYEK